MHRYKRLLGGQQQLSVARNEEIEGVEKEKHFRLV